jgi:hypothetical protein
MLVDRERTIHELLRRHPELIHPALKGHRPDYELVRQAMRLDLVFRIRGRATVVEVKRAALSIDDLAQIVMYCNEIEKESRLSKQHFLVGKRPANATAFEARLKELRYKISPKYLFLDIPTELIWDNLENRYVAWYEEYSNNPRYHGYIKLRV